MTLAEEDEDHWETFVCTSCGWRVSRLKGSFDMPVCAKCRWLDEIDPSGKLRLARERKMKE